MRHIQIRCETPNQWGRVNGVSICRHPPTCNGALAQVLSGFRREGRPVKPQISEVAYIFGVKTSHTVCQVFKGGPNKCIDTCQLAVYLIRFRGLAPMRCCLKVGD